MIKCARNITNCAKNEELFYKWEIVSKVETVCYKFRNCAKSWESVLKVEKVC